MGEGKRRRVRFVRRIAELRFDVILRLKDEPVNLEGVGWSALCGRQEFRAVGQRATALNPFGRTRNTFPCAC